MTAFLHHPGMTSRPSTSDERSRELTRRRSRGARLARVYLSVLSLVALASLPFGGTSALILVVLPAIVLGALIGVALSIMRHNKNLGGIMAAVLYAAVGTFFIYADLRYALETRVTLSIARDFGSALHNHLFSHGALVIGIVHLALAGGTITDR
jgi:hypothetical protein